MNTNERGRQRTSRREGGQIKVNPNAAKSTESRLGESRLIMFDWADTPNMINTEQSLLIAPNYFSRMFVFSGHTGCINPGTLVSNLPHNVFDLSYELCIHVKRHDCLSTQGQVRVFTEEAGGC